MIALAVDTTMTDTTYDQLRIPAILRKVMEHVGDDGVQINADSTATFNVPAEELATYDRTILTPG